MFNYFKNLFSKDVDAIVASFHRAIAKLEAHAESKLNETLAHVEAAEASTKLAQAATAAQIKAQTIAAKLRGIVS